MYFGNKPRAGCSYCHDPFVKPFPTFIRTVDTVSRGVGEKKQNHKSQYHMNKTTRLLITAAALTGLYTGALATKSFAADDKAGTPATKDSKDATAKHDCKGKNACKGQGGCGASDNGCKGKNSCKGKGGCASAMDKKDEPKK
jgi:hypothetical protein